MLDGGKSFKVYSRKKGKGITKLQVGLILVGIKLELVLVGIKVGLVFVGVKLGLAN